MRRYYHVSFSLSASLSLFSALTLFSHAHLWSLKLSLNQVVSKARKVIQEEFLENVLGPKCAKSGLFAKARVSVRVRVRVRVSKGINAKSEI